MKQPQNPEEDLSSSPFLPKAVIWSALVLSDLVIGAACVLWLNPELPPLLQPLEGMLVAAVSLGVTGGLFALEFFLWKAVEGLFR